MEFHDKIRELRKKQGITQDELAEALYVSRTAISKWESGRGFPNIESLKALASFFSVSLDELLSSEELLVIAEDDHKKRQMYMKDLIIGLLDCSFVLLLFLPLFGLQTSDTVYQVPVWALTESRRFLQVVYIILILAMLVFGVITLALQNYQNPFWLKYKTSLSLLLGLAPLCVFVLSRQAYAALFAVMFLALKAIYLTKKP